jgi:hypothetical protein
MARRLSHAAFGCSHLRIELAFYGTSGTLLRESYIALTISKLQVEIPHSRTILQEFLGYL